MLRRRLSAFTTPEEYDALAAWQNAQPRFETRIVERLTRPTRSFACFGALLMGVALPSFLICWHSSFHIKLDGRLVELIPFQLPADRGSGWNLLAFEFLATAFCGPFATLAAIHIYSKLQKLAGGAGINFIVAEGALRGGCLTLLNLPAYAAIKFIDWRVTLAPLLFILLLVVSGVSSGAWIGWQVHRAQHGGSWFPRYHLGTLVATALLWGFLLTCYAP